MKMYLVVMPHSWGRNENRDEALKTAQREGGHGRKTTPRIVFEYDTDKTPKCYIDEIGQLNYEGERPVEIERVEKK